MNENKYLFTGRDREISLLKELQLTKVASFVVVKGRRRIGKSTLVNEYAKSFSKTFRFTALPPEQGVNAQDQRDEFALQFSRQLKLPKISSTDWGELFYALGEQVQERTTTLVFLDEISWMAKGDRTFLGKLKNVWDLYFSKNPKLVLVVCGSISSWINKNIINSTGFVGRISQTITLKPLPLSSCSEFWYKQKNFVSPREKLKLLSVTGCIPRYLEGIRPELSSEENISRLCFQEGALLFDEFDKLFSDLFSRRQRIYKRIVEALKGPSQTLYQITEQLGVEKSGTLSRYLEDLITAGFVSRDYSWSLKTGKQSKISTFRLSDNYLRFYLRYIEPNKEKIIAEGSSGEEFSYFIQSWETLFGLQFENLVLANKDLVYKALNLSLRDIVSSNPFLQTQTQKRKGCQIDLLIQTRFQTLYLCEIRSGNSVVSKSVIEEVQEKIKRLKVPKNFSVRPVLIYTGELNIQIKEQDFFAHTINVEKWLEGSQGKIN